VTVKYQSEQCFQISPLLGSKLQANEGSAPGGKYELYLGCECVFRFAPNGGPNTGNRIGHLLEGSRL